MNISPGIDTSSVINPVSIKWPHGHHNRHIFPSCWSPGILLFSFLLFPVQTSHLCCIIYDFSPIVLSLDLYDETIYYGLVKYIPDSLCHCKILIWISIITFNPYVVCHLFIYYIYGLVKVAWLDRTLNFRLKPLTFQSRFPIFRVF